MAQFLFRYQSILNHREKAEQVCQRALAELMHERNGLIQKLTTMQQTISAAKRDAAEGLQGRIDLQAVAGIARYSARCTAEGHGIVRRVAELENRVEQARKRLLEASRERQALDLLKEKQHEAWTREQRRMEAKRLDDHTAQVYARETQAEPTPCEPSSPRSSLLSSSMSSPRSA
ncbi:MAG: flagellar export protein FliJ [Phycisphaerales bacterium JB063]